MRRIQSLPFGADGCALVAGRQKDPEGFVDTGKRYRGKPLYFSATGATLLGKAVGMVSRDEVADMREELISNKHRINQLEGELAEADAFIDGTEALKRAGLKISRPPGRPPKKKDTP